MSLLTTTGALCLVLLAAPGCDSQKAPQPAPLDTGAADTATEPEGPPKRIFTRRFVANVRTEPDRRAPRIGYLRAGAVLLATTAEPVGTEGCRRGWYELTTGGYVCGGRDVIAFNGTRLPAVRAAQVDRAARLPYQYAYSKRDRIPVYRRLPTPEEAEQFEEHLMPRRRAAPADAGPPAAAAANPHADTPAEPAGIAEPPGTATPLSDAGARLQGAAPAAPTAEAHPEDAGVPDTAPPTLASLETGDRESVLIRHMMAGFYVSLDREFRVGRRRYWRTQQNEYIPEFALGLAEGTDFRGGRVDGPDRALPYGYVMSRKNYGYVRAGRRVRRDGLPGYHHGFAVEGTEEIGGQTYVVGGDDHLYRERDVAIIEARPRPRGIGADEKWIDVDLSRQTLVAYRGDRAVYATLISSGIIRQVDVPELNHATPPGRFHVSAKHLATTMDGDNAFDGPYSIQDVPYVMYYTLGFATHSAFWHNTFGRTKSHGCINMSPRDSQWLFNWADPQLPEGWHGVYPTEDNPGTTIIIHGETPLRR